MRWKVAQQTADFTQPTKVQHWDAAWRRMGHESDKELREFIHFEWLCVSWHFEILRWDFLGEKWWGKNAINYVHKYLRRYAQYAVNDTKILIQLVHILICFGGGHHNHHQGFYVHGSVHRESLSIIVQQDSTGYSFIIYSAESSTCFGWYHQENA